MQATDYRYIFHKVGDHSIVYEPSDQDTSDATYHYYGFLSIDGSWIIQRFEIGAGTIEYRYSAGTSNYAVAWAGKDALSYEYFNEALT